jgi:hypothetical protein
MRWREKEKEKEKSKDRQERARKLNFIQFRRVYVCRNDDERCLVSARPSVIDTLVRPCGMDCPPSCVCTVLRWEKISESSLPRRVIWWKITWNDIDFSFLGKNQNTFFYTCTYIPMAGLVGYILPPIFSFPIGVLPRKKNLGLVIRWVTHRGSYCG